MKKTLIIIFSIIFILTFYRKQHVKPVENPLDSPIFQERLKNSLDRFHSEDNPLKQTRKTTVNKASSVQSPGDLAVSGMCGKTTITWVEKTPVDKKGIILEKKTSSEKYLAVSEAVIFDRQEDGGIRYWTGEKNLVNDQVYEYRIIYKDSEGRQQVKGPVSIRVTCNEKERQMEAERRRLMQDYYRKKKTDKGIKKANTPSPPTTLYQFGEKTYTVSEGYSHWKGKKDAAITMIVFTDFECFYCSRWASILDALLKTFPDDLKIVFKNYPISYHTHSESAAMAALAAGRQGQFWQMHDMLFENSKALELSDIMGYAKHAGLDMAVFSRDLKSKDIKEIIVQEKAEAISLGVKGIPTTFINGKMLLGVPPFDVIESRIKQLLQ